MKKTLLIAAVVALASPAFATKARVRALSNAAHVSDVEYIFGERVTDLHNVGELVTIELGTAAGSSTGAAGVQRAEAGVVRKSNNGTWGFFLGKRSTTFTSAVTTVNTNVNSAAVVGLQAEQNPFTALYGSEAGNMKWAAGLSFSSSDVKGSTLKATDGTTDLAGAKAKTNTMGLIAGVEADMWDASAIIGLSGKATSENAAGTQKLDFTSTSRMGLRGGYKMDTMYFFGKVDMSGGKLELNSVEQAKNERQLISLGVINSHKKDAAEVFYGVSYSMLTDKQTVAPDTKTETTTLPVVIGVEVDANSWLALRGSLTQNVLLGSTKTSNAGVGESNTIADNPTAAAGASLKFGKMVVDATLAAQGSSTLDTSAGNFLTNVALTYNF